MTEVMRPDLFRPLKVFIGYDSRQPVAFHVAAHSVWRRASQPVDIMPLRLDWMPIKRRGLTEFTYSRFLAPYLANYEGYSLFMDSDEIVLADIFELFKGVIEGCTHYDLWVAQGKLRYEWPSVMLFHNYMLRYVLTPDFVNDKTNSLFDFKWVKSLGSLPLEWNHLVGYDAPNPKAKLVHYTQGIPCWPETRDCEFSKEWWAEYEHLRSTVSFEELMGNSVHAKHVYKRLGKVMA